MSPPTEGVTLGALIVFMLLGIDIDFQSHQQTRSLRHIVGNTIQIAAQGKEQNAALDASQERYEELLEHLAGVTKRNPLK